MAVIVIDDDPGTRPDPGLPHLGLELGRSGERMPPRPCSGHGVEVDEDRSWKMTTQVLVMAVAVLQVPAEVDDSDVPVVDVIVQPAGGDERSEGHVPLSTRVSWQKWTALGRDACTFFSERVQSCRLACWPGQAERSAFSMSR